MSTTDLDVTHFNAATTFDANLVPSIAFPVFHDTPGSTGVGQNNVGGYVIFALSPMPVETLTNLIWSFGPDIDDSGAEWDMRIMEPVTKTVVGTSHVTVMSNSSAVFTGSPTPATNYADMEAALQAGAWVDFTLTQRPSALGTAWIYSFWLTATGSTPGGIPPLRRTQRDDLRNSGRNSRQRSLRNTAYL